MSPTIVLFGATGYTGARVAEAMTRRGMRPVLAGRNRARLASLADRLGGLPTAQADATEPGSVRALLNAGDVLVSTVGPFMRYGESAVTAAVDAGAVYLDSTGEPPFIRRVFEQHGPAAARTGAALLTAFGSEYVPGTLAGALALTEAGVATATLHTGYFQAGGRGQAFSRGTLNSVAGVLFERMYSWRDGTLVDEPAGARYRTFQVAGKTRPGVSIGATEQFALPRLAASGVAPRLREVDTYLGWFGPVSRLVQLSSRGLPALLNIGPVSRALSAVAEMAVNRAAEEPSASALANSTSYAVGEAFSAAGQPLASVVLSAPDSYAMTAELLAWAADRAAREGVAGAGALDAVSAFGLPTLVAGAAEAGIMVLDPNDDTQRAVRPGPALG
jgi:short subunit dehydrogenase-like uncharacterized protein